MHDYIINSKLLHLELELLKLKRLYRIEKLKYRILEFEYNTFIDLQKIENEMKILLSTIDNNK